MGGFFLTVLKWVCVAALYLLAAAAFTGLLRLAVLVLDLLASVLIGLVRAVVRLFSGGPEGGPDGGSDRFGRG